jgi:hypothetical protein
MRKTYALALVPFALSMLGAQDCVFDQIGKPVPGTPGAQPAKPFCYTDPPQGCAAYCQDVDTQDFTPQCANVEAGPREAAFQTFMEDKLNMLLAQGTHVCDGTNSGDGVTSGARATPCMFGFSPVEWPNQDHTVCMPPPPDCPW